MVTSLIHLINYLLLPDLWCCFLAISSLCFSSSLRRTGFERLKKVFATPIIVRLTFELSFWETSYIQMQVSFIILILAFGFCCQVLLFSNNSLTSPFKSLSFSMSLCDLLLGYLRPADHHSSDHHSSSKAVHLQCEPLYCPPAGPHLAPNRFHQQESRSSTNHCYCACHPPATSPSSRLRATILRDEARPRCPVANNTARRNSGPSMS